MDRWKARARYNVATLTRGTRTRACMYVRKSASRNSTHVEFSYVRDVP